MSIKSLSLGMNGGGAKAPLFAEGYQAEHVIELVGTGLNNSASRSVKVDSVEVVPNGHIQARGLSMIVLSPTLKVVSATIYDTYGDAARVTALAKDILAVSPDSYIAITSFDATRTNSELTAALESIKAVAWSRVICTYLSLNQVRTPYALFAKRDGSVVYEAAVDHAANRDHARVTFMLDTTSPNDKVKVSSHGFGVGEIVENPELTNIKLSQEKFEVHELIEGEGISS